MFYAHDIGWAEWLLMSVGMVAFWGLVIAGIVAVVRGMSRERHERAADPDRPLDALELRLARGEITVEEYERLRDALLGLREKTPA